MLNHCFGAKHTKTKWNSKIFSSSKACDEASIVAAIVLAPTEVT